MQWILVFLIFLLMLSCGHSPEQQAPASETKLSLHGYSSPLLHYRGEIIVLLPLAANPPRLGEKVSVCIGQNLVSFGFHVIDLAYLKKELKEKGIDISSISIPDNDHLEIGKMFGADSVMIGTVQNRGDWIDHIEFRIVRIKEKRVIAGASCALKSQYSQEFHIICSNLVNAMFSQQK